MTIPTLVPYSLPTETDLPARRLGWTLDLERTVLLVHDMQQYFLDFYAGGFEPLVKQVRRLRELGLPTVFTAQPPAQSPAERGLLLDRWGTGIQGGAQIVAGLEPTSDDVVLTKKRYSAFFGTDLLDRLRAAGRDQLVICGVYAHIGVTATAIDAFSHGIAPFVPADAVGDFSRDRHLAALEHLAAVCAAVTTVESLAREAQPTRPGVDVRGAVLAQLDEPVSEHDNLLDAGLDSIRVMALVEQWRAQGLAVTFADLAADPTIAGFERALRAVR